MNIIDCEDNYIDTQQKTIILIIQKKKFMLNNNIIGNNKYILNISNYTIFGTFEDIHKIKSLYVNSNDILILILQQ